MVIYYFCKLGPIQWTLTPVNVKKRRSGTWFCFLIVIRMAQYLASSGKCCQFYFKTRIWCFPVCILLFSVKLHKCSGEKKLNCKITQMKDQKGLNWQELVWKRAVGFGRPQISYEPIVWLGCPRTNVILDGINRNGEFRSQKTIISLSSMLVRSLLTHRTAFCLHVSGWTMTNSLTNCSEKQKWWLELEALENPSLRMRLK